MQSAAIVDPVDTVTGLLLDQLDFYLHTQLFPRLEGLDDEEYFWEPVPGCWTVVEGPGGWAMQQAWPRLAHHMPAVWWLWWPTSVPPGGPAR